MQASFSRTSGRYAVSPGRAVISDWPGVLDGPLRSKTRTPASALTEFPAGRSFDGFSEFANPANASHDSGLDVDLDGPPVFVEIVPVAGSAAVLGLKADRPVGLGLDHAALGISDADEGGPESFGR